MKNFKFLVVLFFTAILLSACKSANVQKVGNSNNILDSSIKVGSLENGMAYYVKENKEPLNRIQLRLLVKAGSCMEDDDQQGVAHFIEHMCFNGTKNFEKSAIVDYFETIGMKFGPEVNAETNFLYTQFFLEIPADDPEMLKKSLLVLHDWASAVSFESEEIEKERGVILEEYRTRKLGFGGRVTDSLVDYFGDNSIFENRLPIGKTEVIKTISRERMLDFYNKWYRPEFMSVILVGDTKSDTMIKAIQEVMSDIPASDGTVNLPKFTIPKHTNDDIYTLKDSEYGNLEIYLANVRENYKEAETYEEFKELYAISFAKDIFNTRLSEISTSANASFLGASNSIINIIENSINDVLYFVPKEGKIVESFKSIIDEYDKFVTFGITNSELDNMKKVYLQNLETSYKNRDYINSATYCSNIFSNIMNNTVLMTSENSYKQSVKIINELTADEIVEAYKKVMPNRGSFIYIIQPEKIKDMLSEKELKSIWREYKNPEIKAYEEENSDDNFVAKPASKCKVAKKTAIKEIGATEYLLENGIRIITKKNDNDKGIISFNAGSKGGTFKINEKDVPSVNVSLDYMLLSGFEGMTYSQFSKKCEQKQVNFNCGMNNSSEYFAGNVTTQNVEYLLQVLNLVFTKPQFTNDGWTVLDSYYSQNAKNFDTMPMNVYQRRVTEIVFGKTNYRAFVDMDFYNQLKPEVSEKGFKERFGNPADFTYVFVGDMDENKLIDLCCSYLGTLKTSNEREEFEDKKFNFPNKSVTETVKRGIDNQGMVYVAFTTELPKAKDVEQSFKEGEGLNDLLSLLEIRLREVIREDKGGSYGVNLNGYIDGNTERYSLVEISFGCEPEREEELRNEVIAEIKNIQAGNIGDENIVKIKETKLRSYDNVEYNNNWWMNRIKQEYVYCNEPTWVSSDKTKTASWVTKEALTENAQKYLNTDKVITVYLKPEK